MSSSKSVSKVFFVVNICIFTKILLSTVSAHPIWLDNMPNDLYGVNVRQVHNVLSSMDADIYESPFNAKTVNVALGAISFVYSGDKKPKTLLLRDKGNKFIGYVSGVDDSQVGEREELATLQTLANVDPEKIFRHFDSHFGRARGVAEDALNPLTVMRLNREKYNSTRVLLDNVIPNTKNWLNIIRSLNLTTGHKSHVRFVKALMELESAGEDMKGNVFSQLTNLIWHSEQKLLYDLLGESNHCEPIFPEISDDDLDDLEGVIIHIHSHKDFCKRCWNTLENWLDTMVYNKFGKGVSNTLFCQAALSFTTNYTPKDGESIEERYDNLEGLNAGVSFALDENLNSDGKIYRRPTLYTRCAYILD